MILLKILQTIAWGMCVIYATIPAFWLMVHPFAERWRKRGSSPFRVLLPLWLALWVIFGAASWKWLYTSVYQMPWSWLPALVMLASGFRIYGKIRAAFTRAHLIGQVELEPQQRQTLVTSGLHGIVRHPIYLAHALNMLGWSLGSGTLAPFILTGIAILSGAVMIRQEERELQQRFGEAYREYQKRVPAVIPRFPIHTGASGAVL